MADKYMAIKKVSTDPGYYLYWSALNQWEYHGDENENRDVYPPMLFNTIEEGQDHLRSQAIDPDNGIDWMAPMFPIRNYKEYPVVASVYAEDWTLSFTEGDMHDNWPQRKRWVNSKILSETEPVGAKDASAIYYAIVNAEGDLATPWYDTREELYYDEDGKTLLEQGGWFTGAMLVPRECVPLQLPIDAVVQNDRKGKPCIYLNDHPEINGNNTARRKIYFPDRSMGELRLGPITVTELNDKGNYGFFKGEQHSYVSPLDEALVLWCQQHDRFGAPLQWHEVEGFGDFVTVGLGGIYDEAHLRYATYLVEGENGEVVQCPSLSCLPISAKTRVGWCCGWDLALQHKFGIQSEDDLRDEFVQFQFRASEADSNPKFFSEDFSAALADGIFEALKYNNIPVIGVGYNLGRLYRFSKESLDAMIAHVNEVNQEANDRMRSLIKKGKVKLNTVQRRII